MGIEAREQGQSRTLMPDAPSDIDGGLQDRSQRRGQAQRAIAQLRGDSNEGVCRQLRGSKQRGLPGQIRGRGYQDAVHVSKLAIAILARCPIGFYMDTEGCGRFIQ